MDPKNRQKTLLIIAITALVLFVGDSVVVNPLLAAWSRGEEQVAALQKKVADGNQMLAAKKGILDHWEKMKTVATPQSKTAEQNKLFEAYDRWQRNSRIKSDRTNPMWKEGDEMTTIEFTADLSGNIQSLQQFLWNVENDLHNLGLKVESMKIAAHSDDGQQLTLGLQLSGLVFGQTNSNQQ